MTSSTPVYSTMESRPFTGLERQARPHGRPNWEEIENWEIWGKAAGKKGVRHPVQNWRGQGCRSEWKTGIFWESGTSALMAISW
jgi:hypothetical protein